ncbi:MAG: hypothetical protein U0R28_01960 [Candidatus Nanopelagicales bacterium]
MRTLLVDGHVYSPAENFATALLIEDGVIAWIGAEGGAAMHTTDVDEVVELHGDLIAPGFVHLAVDEAAVSDGFVHAQRAGMAADRWPVQVWDEYADKPLAVVPADPCRLRSRIAAGVPTALLPPHTGGSGWEVIRAAVYGVDPAERLTARGAFSALTRGAWRLLGRPEKGVLRVGAEATFIRWHVENLVVESPDTRISNWSTDPRSATPGLPALQDDAPLPEFVEAWLGGTR